MSAPVRRGAPLANRLSADPTVAVAVVEAGGSDDREAIRVPRRYFSLWGTDVDWGYVSTPQPGTDGRTHQMPRGRVLGGTSSLNGMVYLRGARSDYDRWADLGCVGWDWSHVSTAFSMTITMTFIALFSLVWGYFARTTWVAWSVEACSVHL